MKNYTYVIARIRALEAKMLSSVQVNRMIEAPDLDRAFFVLNETTYADHLSAAVNPFDYEDIIKEELTRVYNFLNYYAGDNESLKILWRKYDYGNAKILIRAVKRDRKDALEMLSGFGNLNGENLFKYFFSGEASLPVWLEKPVNEAVIAFEEQEMPEIIDDMLDEALFRDFGGSDCPLLQKIAMLYKSIEYPVDLEGNNKTIEILRGVKRRSFGIEPVITFWLAKEMEVKTIRQILIAKKHHLPTSLIKERVRSVYV